MSTPALKPGHGRQQVLDCVRAATGSASGSAGQAASGWKALPRAYIRAGSLSPAACVELMLKRLREYDAEVAECPPEALPSAIAAQLAGSGRCTFVAPAGLPPEWLAAGFEWKIDGRLTTAEIEQAEGVVTTCYCGVADSGTIVLHHSATEGRRVLSLLPDWHLCVLRASQVVETLPEYFSRCQQAPALHPSDEDLSLGTPALVTWISGPSATADIEMTRIKGVHGPRFLHVILVQDLYAQQKIK
ncbi:MAG: lactate utilization protein C [Terracidiphilus sp.]